MKHVNYSMKTTHILCHYSEIGLKGKNRSYFENTLKRNIHDALNVTVPNAIDTIEKLRGRFLITLSETNTNSIDSILSTLENRFGLAYFAPAIKIHPELDSMKLSALEILKDITFDTFRITARRSDPYLPYSSQKINEEIGAEIVSKLNKIVNLSNPEVTCYIDMLQEGTFVYTQKISGPGGLPVGVSGKVGVMLSGGIDSPVAAYYAMKRGASPLYIHFHSVPHVSPASIEKVRETVQLLKKYHLRAKLYIIEFAPVQDEIFANANPKLLVLHYRRCMIRIS
ncbi:MAG TPA: tRNA 4-thiouridine(8) synthase ThiI, partial [Candidatus Marinimicrobia bacterium]|nr:tRNA 4-thiouridine(8) synthase ThiI [Candidatus Neomarinimicrobiota bacterium]